jgi:hypothetical protein
VARDKLGMFLGKGHPINYNLKDEAGNPEFLQQYRDTDLTKDPSSGKELLDLDNSDTGLLGDYLRYVMDNFAHNEFPIKGKNYRAATANRGDALPKPEQTGAEDVFAASNTPGGIELGKYSSSGKFSGDIIDKTAGSRGHNLLKSTPGSFGSLSPAIDTTGKVISTPATSENDLLRESSDILETYNRFSPDKRAFAERGKTTEEADSDPTMYPHREFGDYTKGSESESFSYDSLIDVAASLMAKSAGWDTDGEKPGTSRDPEKVFPSEFAMSYQDTQIATGKKNIDVEKLRSKNSYGTPTRSGLGESYRSGRGSFLVDNDENADISSFGTVYTPDNKFDDPSSGAVASAQAIASLVAVSALGKNLMDDVIGALDSTSNVPLGRGPFLKGAFGNHVDINIRALYQLLLTPTHSAKFSTCVDRGISVMFDSKIKTLSKLGSRTGTQVNDAESKATDMLTGSPGYWLAVCRGIIRNVDGVFSDAESVVLGNFTSIENLVKLLGSSKLIGFFKYLASIGDISLTAGMGTSLSNTDDDNSFFNVDKLPDGPATRVGKSRSSEGNTTTSLAWRGTALPSVYLLPREILKATVEMGTGGFGVNPAKGMMATTLWDKTYADMSLKGEGQRIPGGVVERLENTLDAEYCPFYFHDLRTNEIVAFHAFLSSLTDTFSPQFTDMKGYGRMDPVQIYSNTTRNIGLSFIVAATSQEDFDEMWWKINKLVTLVYPQYSKGTQVATADSKYIQPFSQVLKSSPMIRLRVGDVVKSNYSKFNLARTFGIGTDDAVDLKPPGQEDAGGSKLPGALGGAMDKLNALLDKDLVDFFLGLYGSPLGLISNDVAGLGFLNNRMGRAAVSQFLVNGFGNPILTQVVGQRLRDPDTVVNAAPKSFTLSSVIDGLGAGGGGLFGYGYRSPAVVFLKPTDGKGYKYKQGSDTEIVRFNRPIRCMISERIEEPISKSDASSKMSKTRTIYKVVCTDLGAPFKYLLKGHFFINHSDIIADPAFIFNVAMLPALSLRGALNAAVESLTNEAAVAAGVPADTVNLNVSDTAKFFDSEENPIVKAFNSSRGRGLAGFVRRLTIKHLDGTTTWETDWNSRAPKFVKVEIGFSPIHDIQPGIDSQGFNRAPVYNVGRSMEHIAGDPYDDNGHASKFGFRNQGRATFKSKKIVED